MRDSGIPSLENDFLAGHVAIIRNSLLHWTGRELVPTELSDSEAARYVFQAPFALLSHDTAEDPVFNYANLTALRLFSSSWDEMTSLPSRLSAEPVNRSERARLLSAVSAHGYIENYQGVRISSDGRRFFIEKATVWNLLDADLKFFGQAACFADWKFL